MILVIALIAVLAGSLALLAALHTRAFIALALADLRQNAGLLLNLFRALSRLSPSLTWTSDIYVFPPSDAPGCFLSAL